MKIKSGQQIGNYLLEEPLQSGGSGMLWKARHMLSNKQVAIKIVNNNVDVQRVRNEARLQSSILHPNIAAIYEFLWFDQQPCIVMELVNGQALDQFIRKNSVQGTRLNAIIDQILMAIQYLHERKIIHRDLKPANIMIQKDDQIKLIDFGIAKGWSSPNITKLGTAIGTPEYMSPERFEGMHSVESDIWAIGLIIYELIHGKNLFDGYTGGQNRAILKDRRLIELKNSSTPSPWNRIISKCLKTNPSHRYRSIKQLLVDISKNTSSNTFAFTINPRLTKPKNILIGAIGIISISIGALFLKSNHKVNIPCEGVKIKFNIKPSNAVIETSKGHELKKGDWLICGEPGTSINVKIRAENYRQKTFKYTFPSLNDHLTYVLEKK